jgi:SulP family sulfate permease
MAAACFGGMPATGAIARTAVNVRSGGRTRLASVVHALVLVVVVYLGGTLVARIPLAALAGVLMVTAVRMVDVHAVRMVVRSTRADAVVLVLTAVATVAFDLIVAVEIGLAVADTTSLQRDPLEAVEVDVTLEHALLEQHIIAYRLDGPLFFGAAQRFLAEFTAIDGVDVVILRLPDLQHLDATGAQALGEIVDQLEARHVTVLVKGPRPEHRRVLEAVGTLDRLAHERHLFDDLDDAIAHARLHVARTRRNAA